MPLRVTSCRENPKRAAKRTALITRRGSSRKVTIDGSGVQMMPLRRSSMPLRYPNTKHKRGYNTVVERGRSEQGRWPTDTSVKHGAQHCYNFASRLQRRLRVVQQSYRPHETLYRLYDSKLQPSPSRACASSLAKTKPRRDARAPSRKVRKSHDSLYASAPSGKTDAPLVPTPTLLASPRARP